MHWIAGQGYRNVVVEIANEYPHKGFVHEIIRQPSGQAALLKLARQTLPSILLTSQWLWRWKSGCRSGC